ncbi:MAG: phytanoyl-CoA dioxygenase family protein [Pseudomonadota bacterium]
MNTQSRDLTFRPSAQRDLIRLTADQVAHYNREGFVQPFDVFDSAEIEENRTQVDAMMAALGQAGNYGINCYQARLAQIWDIATHDLILDHVQDLIGPDIICWASAILSKKPRDPKQVPWHQDASFWNLSPARTVTVWLAIDDADESNSAMRFIPRTHRMGALETASADSTSVFHIETAGAETLGQPFTNTLKAGQISLHADMLVHGSLANTSDRRRCGLTLRYCPPDVRITDANWAQGVEPILCRGSDPSGHWQHHPRPHTTDITQTQSPHVIGNN